MSKIYDRCNDEVSSRVDLLLAQNYQILRNAELRVDLLFVSTPDGEGCLKLHGYDCYAVVRITSAKERAAGRGDAEIVIDQARYNAMTGPERDALLDHELFHLKPSLDKFGALELDDHGRPALEMRMHDREYGWFDEIARRHGEHSTEVQQARAFLAGNRQLYLDLPPAPSVPRN